MLSVYFVHTPFSFSYSTKEPGASDVFYIISCDARLSGIRAAMASADTRKFFKCIIVSFDSDSFLEYLKCTRFTSDH